MKHTYYGQFGGTYVPEIFMPILKEFDEAFEYYKQEKEFQSELNELLKKYAGRETPLYKCRNFLSEISKHVYLKREDLLHGGAHKINQVIGQALVAKRLGKKRLIAETGAGQHGVATAMIGALLNFETIVYMGKHDYDRQHMNVLRMEMMGAKVIAVNNGSQTLKDAINEALRDWSSSYKESHYLIGTAAGPYPFPKIVKYFQEIIGIEARRQILATEGRLPDHVVACVGGGSNAIGIFSAFLEDKVSLIGVEPAGHGLESKHHGATLTKGKVGILHGAKSYVLQDENGNIAESYSISAGLDYPGIGPEHSFLKDSGRVDYGSVTDDQVISACLELSRTEGIIPALESSHALAFVKNNSDLFHKDNIIIINLSGRGDKDMHTINSYLESQK